MGFSTYGSWALERRLRSCPGAYGIFLDQGLNSCLLHQQSDPLPVNHKEALVLIFESFPGFCLGLFECRHALDHLNVRDSK